MNLHRRPSAEVNKVIAHTRRRFSERRGFTLIELMIAVVLLLTATSGIVPMYLTSLSQASAIRHKSLATNIAREKMEQIRQLDYRDIVSPDQLAEDFGAAASARGIDFTIDYDVSVTDYDNDVLKEVTVNVSWTAPPKVSVASASTLVHQQFLGPRGGRLTVVPDYIVDPLGTPFQMTSALTVANYYVAEADWNLIFGDVNNPDDTYLGAYARFTLYDDNGASWPLGSAAKDYKLDASYLYYTTDANGALTEARFRLPFLDYFIPDGYWELRAIVYNKYDQPGNTWRLRIRVENGKPAKVTQFQAVPIATDDLGTSYSGLDLYWMPGAERDRQKYVLERSINGAAYAQIAELSPGAATYHDPDPFGDASNHNTYAYRVRAQDIAGLWADWVTCSVDVPPAVVTTTTTTLWPTTTTLAPPTTTTTLAAYPVTIDNNTRYTYTVTIKNSSGVTVSSLTIKKNKTESLELPPGIYNIYATASGQPARNGTFTLPPPNPNDTLVLQILSIGN